MTAPPDPFCGKAIALLLMAGAVAYTGAVNTGFVFDDLVWISANPQITDPAEYLRTSGDRSLVALSVVANHRLGGLNPLGYHAFNVAVHLAAGLTLFALLARVLALPRWGGRFAGRETHLAFAAALLWTVHPLNTQAVTYVIQRAESMMGLFYLLTFYCWTRAATGPRPLLWQALAGGSFLASCFCKEVAVTLPPVLLLYDRLFLAASWKQVFARWRGYLLLAGVWALKLYFVLGSAFGGATEVGVGFGLRTITKTQYALTQTEVILHYLRLAVWPVGQSADYNGWPVATSFADVWPSAVGLGGILLASAALLYLRPRVGFLAAWFFLILAPTSSVMPIIDVAFEHRMYLSLAAVAVGVVLLGDLALQSWPAARGRWRLVGGAGVLVAAALLGRQALERHPVYRGSASLQRDRTGATAGFSARTKTFEVTDQIGDGEFDAALPGLLELERRQPNYFGTRVTRGLWHQAHGEYPQAVAAYRAAIPVGGPMSRTRAEGLILRAQLAAGDGPGAAETARQVTSYSRLASHHLSLAAAERLAGNESASAAARGEAERLDPKVAAATARDARVTLFAKPKHPDGRKGELTAAYWLAAVACESSAAEPEWFDTLAQLAARTGRFDDAVAAADRGLALATEKADERWKQALTDRRSLYVANKVYGPTD